MPYCSFCHIWVRKLKHHFHRSPACKSEVHTIITLRQPHEHKTDIQHEIELEQACALAGVDSRYLIPLRDNNTFIDSRTDKFYSFVGGTGSIRLMKMVRPWCETFLGCRDVCTCKTRPLCLICSSVCHSGNRLCSKHRNMMVI